MPRTFTTEIPDTQCMGDSLLTINTNYNNLDTAVQDLSSYSNTLQTTLSTQNNNISTLGNLTVPSSFSLNTNTIKNISGVNLFVNGYPRQPGQIIEYLSSPCDGSSVTVGSGTYTFQNVTTWPGAVYSYTDLTGSTLTYTPPTGTTRVIYRFNFGMWWGADHSINHFKFFINGVEVVFARHNRSGRYPESKYSFEWPIAIGGTANSNTGRQSSWSEPKTLKMQWRSYGGSNNGQPHVTNYWDGASSNQLVMPTLTIIAIA